MLRVRISIAMAIFALGGCEHSIFRTFNLNDNSSAVLDAKQRVISNVKVDQQNYFVGRMQPNRIVCAEPSPDVAQAISTAISASLDAAAAKGLDKSLGASFGLSSAEALTQLGRIATVQLLRDELADLCRSYANGAVSSTTYTLRLSKLDKKMVTLLISESAAGGLNRALASAASTANAGGNSVGNAEQITDAQKREKETGEAASAGIAAVKDVEKAIAALGANPDAAVLKAKQEDLKKKEGERDTNLRAYADAREALLLLTRIAAKTSASATAQPSTATTSFAPGIEFATLQRQFLDDDDLGTILDACMTAGDMLVAPNSTERERTEELRKKLEEAESNAERAGARSFTLRRHIENLANKYGWAGDFDRFKVPVITYQPNNPVEMEALQDSQLLNHYRENLAVAQAEDYAATAIVESRRKTFAAAANPPSPLSPLGRFCTEPTGLQTLINLIDKDAQAKREIERLRALSEGRNSILQICAPVLDGTKKEADPALKAYCQKALNIAEPNSSQGRPGVTTENLTSR